MLLANINSETFVFRTNETNQFSVHSLKFANIESSIRIPCDAGIFMFLMDIGWVGELNVRR